MLMVVVVCSALIFLHFLWSSQESAIHLGNYCDLLLEKNTLMESR